MSSSRRKLALNTVSVNLGCGSCRRRPKLLHMLFHPKPKPKNPTYQKHKLCHQSSYDTSTTTTTNTTFSPCYVESSPQFCDYNMKPSSRTVKGFGRVGSEGVAVEKDSQDPYLDLRELLNCFLQLNSPNHHGVIVRAFTEIWNGVFSVRSNSSPRFHLTRKSRDF